jgi:hypothetical protein
MAKPGQRRVPADSKAVGQLAPLALERPLRLARLISMNSKGPRAPRLDRRESRRRRKIRAKSPSWRWNDGK